MSDESTILALLTALTAKVDDLGSKVAVLMDRSDAEAEEKAVDKLRDRVGLLETDLVERRVKAKMLVALASGGGVVGGLAGSEIGAKLLALIGG